MDNDRYLKYVLVNEKLADNCLAKSQPKIHFFVPSHFSKPDYC